MRSSTLARCLVALALCSAAIAPTAAAQTETEPVELRVMSFNIWYGATRTDLSKVVDAIRAAEADVVGMQEPYARLRRIAAELGFHASPRMHVISRYPILEPSGSDGRWAYLLLGPDRVVAIANTHLACCPYTPYRIVHRGMLRAAALRQERNTRLEQIQGHLAALRPILEARVPTFFTGDFNTPSWRDWTPAAVRARGLPYPVRWPVSRAMEAAGFVDSYRAVHPNPLADPGFTWTPGYPAPFVYDWDVHDRIDFVWAFGDAVPVESSVVGESRTNADVVVRPWPSDHRAVVSTFRVTPAPAPPLVAAEVERSPIGAPLRVHVHVANAQGASVVLAPVGDPTPAIAQPIAARDATLDLSTEGLAPGGYELLLLDGTATVLARDEVVLVAPGQTPELLLADDTLEGDQVLEVSWAFAPGNRFDWLGIYAAGASPKVAAFKAWRYTRGAIEGSSTLGPGVRGPAGWPLRPGAYELHLLIDDSYRSRASVPFTVLG